jgi:enoyl-[acyl-carrier protein] reductase III
MVQRTAIVTGGSRGIGRRIAETLAADGTHVILTYRRNDGLAREVVAGIADAGGSAVAVRLELESADDIDLLFADHFGADQSLDILVANAAASAFHPVDDLKSHHLARSWETNVRSFVLLAQRAARHMDAGGRIVAVTSYGSMRAFPAYGAIGADKAAIESWVRHMAADFGRRGITVNAVNAGLVDTDSLHHYYELPGVPPLESVVAKIPLGRVGTVDDVAGAIQFLTGPHGGYVTGHVLVVDGGLTVVAPPFWSEFSGLEEKSHPENDA